jgi:hypothetical protein
MNDVEVSLECLRATVNEMRYAGERRVSKIVESVVSQGFTEDEARLAIRRVAEAQRDME